MLYERAGKSTQCVRVDADIRVEEDDALTCGQFEAAIARIGRTKRCLSIQTHDHVRVARSHVGELRAACVIYDNQLHLVSWQIACAYSGENAVKRLLITMDRHDYRQLWRGGGDRFPLHREVTPSTSGTERVEGRAAEGPLFEKAQNVAGGRSRTLHQQRAHVGV